MMRLERDGLQSIKSNQTKEGALFNMKTDFLTREK